MGSKNRLPTPTRIATLGPIISMCSRKRLPTQILGLSLILALFGLYTVTISAEEKYAPGMVIVKFSSDDRTRINNFLAGSGAYSAERVFPNAASAGDPYRLSAIYQLMFSQDADVESIARRYEDNPAVEYAQPNYLNHLCSEGPPDDLFYEKQWGLEVIEARDAWKIEKGSRDVVVAVVDTGVEYDHEDLESRIWINPGEIPGNGLDDDQNGYVDDIRGWDFADSPGLHTNIDHRGRENDPMDENGHGTHVSGIISAVQDNSIGVAGVTWNCRIMALRGGGDFLEDDDVSAAIVYAADNGAHIINMSWGGNHLAYVVRDATEYAYSRGCVLVAAAGNSDLPNVIYPALHKHIIAVGATEKFDKKASFSNYGPGVDIAAPGDRIYSTVLKDRYAALSGTSMASPMVAAVAALMVSKRPALTNEEVAQILRSSVDEIDEPLFAGAGRVNAVKALTATSPLVARIASPGSGSGADTALTISGTATGSHFRSFTLEYSPIPEIDWRPIGAVHDTPMFHEPLDTWDVAHLDEGDYVVRLKVFGHDRLEAEDKVIVAVDHSPPEITNMQVVTVLHNDIYASVVVWYTDDLAYGEMYVRPAGSQSEFRKLTTGIVTTGHSIQVSGEMPPGNYQYFVTAANAAGLITVDDNDGDYYPFEIETLRITSDGFQETATDMGAMSLVDGTVDFDGNGKAEIVGMIVSDSQYNEVRIYEKNGAGDYVQVFESDKDYFPWDMGDTDGDGRSEILGSKRDLTFLYESPVDGVYPTEKIWEMEGIQGGQIADMDADGQKEIVARRLDTSEIIVYENRGDNSYLKAARLQNPTEGHNHLANSAAISDMDGDGKIEMVAGDGDGDLFIYENTTNDRYAHTWTGGVFNSEIRYITAGDFDGDGTDEFVVGGRGSEPSNLARQKWKFTRWVYTIFDSIGQDEYEAVWSQEIIGAKPDGGIVAGDVDGDGRDEIVFLTTPNIYIFKYVEPGIYEPLWRRFTDSTGRPIVVDLDGDGSNVLLFSDEDKILIARYAGFGDASQRPWGVSAIPLGETEVELSWNGPPETHSYKIYRGTAAKRLHLIATVQGADTGYFRDTGLETETEYWYAVSAVDSAGQESERSQSDFAIPNSPPQLLFAKYVPPRSISLTFNEPMGSLAKDQSHYAITSLSGRSETPSSAILHSQGNTAMVTADHLQQGDYTITVFGVRDTTGVLISAHDNSAAFHVPAQDTVDSSDLSRMIVYPNPVMPNSRHSSQITFDNLPPATTIRIYSYDGQLVRDLGEVEPGRSRKFWYLDNNQHQDVSSGVYIYVIQSAGNEKKGKIAVVR